MDSKRMSGMRYDDIITYLGDFGTYQKTAFYVYLLPAVIKSAIVMSAVFILSLPDYRCALPGYQNDTYSIQNEVHQQMINSSIPLVVRDHGVLAYDGCDVYEAAIPPTANTSNSRKACDRWVYDTSEISSSMSIEYDFVCTQRVMRSHINMGYFAGSLAGSILFGSLSDLYGRKTSLILCLALNALSATSQYFTTSLYVIIVLRALQGMSGTMFAISATTGMELVGPKKRTFAGVLVEVFWVLGQPLAAFVAYFTDDWRLFQLFWGLASLMLVGALCFLPESPRWLIEKGKTQKARKILAKIAKSNKKQLSKDCLGPRQEYRKSEKKALVRGLLNNRVLFIQSSIVFLNWFAVNFLYYGLTLNVDNMHGSLYVNYMLMATGELAAYGVCFVMLRFLGRKTSYVASMIVAAISCLVILFPAVYGTEGSNWTMVFLATLGKLSASVAYGILYIITVEIFPTSVRNSVMGLCAVFENCGGLVSPYIADLGIIVGGSLTQAMPFLVFGCSTLIAGLSALFLPETKGKPLPENMEEIMYQNGGVSKEQKKDTTGTLL